MDLDVKFMAVLRIAGLSTPRTGVLFLTTAAYMLHVGSLWWTCANGFEYEPGAMQLRLPLRLAGTEAECEE